MVLYFCAIFLEGYIINPSLKKDNPEEPKDCHLASFSNTLCKLIPKLWASRLRLVILELIFEEQGAFAYYRDISDDVLLVQKVIH